MIILACLDILTKWVKFTLLFTLLAQLEFQTTTLSLHISTLLPHRSRTHPFTLMTLTTMLLNFFPLLFLLFPLLRLLLHFLRLRIHVGLYLFLLRLFLTPLCLLSSLQLHSLGLPLNHLLRNNIYNSLVLNPSCNVLLKLIRIALSIEVGIK